MFKATIFYYEWPSTAGNHAGMAYFARRLKENYPHQVRLIAVPVQISQARYRVQKLWRMWLVSRLSLGLDPQERFFFTEYLSGRISGDHRAIALEMRRRGMQNRLIGLVHLPKQSLLSLYGSDYIDEGLEALDKIIVFGHSLGDYFREIGFGEKVCETFYYADTRYYMPAPSPRDGGNNLRVIFMGSLYRNYTLLKQIVLACPDIQFEICMGKQSLSDQFGDLPNVNLYPYLPEAKLIAKIHQADANLSIFDDTVGSNVIVTSLACGLPQVVSDVGSIRDYCTSENAFLCKDPQDYINALTKLSENPDLRKSMSHAARRQAERFSLENSIQWLENLFEQHV